MDSGKKILSFEEFVNQGMPDGMNHQTGAEPMGFGNHLDQPSDMPMLSAPMGGHSEMPVPEQPPMPRDTDMDLPMMDEPTDASAETPEMPHEDEPEQMDQENV